MLISCTHVIYRAASRNRSSDSCATVAAWKAKHVYIFVRRLFLFTVATFNQLSHTLFLRVAHTLFLICFVIDFECGKNVDSNSLAFNCYQFIFDYMLIYLHQVPKCLLAPHSTVFILRVRQWRRYRCISIKCIFLRHMEHSSLTHMMIPFGPTQCQCCVNAFTLAQNEVKKKTHQKIETITLALVPNETDWKSNEMQRLFNCTNWPLFTKSNATFYTSLTLWPTPHWQCLQSIDSQSTGKSIKMWCLS